MKIILQKWHIREFLFTLKTNMNTTLKTSITIKEICDGFVYNQLEGKGLFALSGNLGGGYCFAIFLLKKKQNF
jgi:hypothetical protein